MIKRLPSRVNKLLYLFSFLVNTNIMITLLLYLVNILPVKIAGIMVIIYTTLQLSVVCNYDTIVIYIISHKQCQLLLLLWEINYFPNYFPKYFPRLLWEINYFPKYFPKNKLLGNKLFPKTTFKMCSVVVFFQLWSKNYNMLYFAFLSPFQRCQYYGQYVYIIRMKNG